jgi:hypothetical protein
LFCFVFVFCFYYLFFLYVCLVFFSPFDETMNELLLRHYLQDWRLRD